MASGERAARQVLEVPDAAFPPDVPLSPGVVAGDFVFTSSLGATDWTTGLPPAARVHDLLPLSGDNPVRLETRALYNKLDATLVAGGSSLDRGVQVNQWVNTYGSEDGRDPADRDEVALFYERWRSVVHPYIQTRDEFLLSDRPASACMPIDRLPSVDEHVQVELVSLTAASGIVKRAYEHEVHMPLGGYSIGIEAGPWLFTAGFTGVDFVHGIRPESRVPEFIWYGNQIYNETTETLRQLKVTVEAGGGALADTVKALVYVTPFAMRNLPALEEAWRVWWPTDPPARAIIPVSGVGLRGTNVEIMLTLVRPGHGLEREPISTDRAPRLGHAAQAVKAGSLVFLSTQLGISADGTPASRPANDRAFPHLRRSVRDEIAQIHENVDAICRAAGTSISQAVKTHLFLNDFGDLSTALPAWGAAFSEGYPAGGFFETPPGTQEVPSCRLTADVIAHCG